MGGGWTLGFRRCCMATINVRDGLCSIYSWVCKEPSPSFQGQTETWSLLDNICFRVCLATLWHWRWFQVLQSNFKNGYIFGLVCLSYGQTLQPWFCNIVSKVSRKNCNFISRVHTSKTAYVRLMSHEDGKDQFEGVLGGDACILGDDAEAVEALGEGRRKQVHDSTYC